MSLWQFSWNESIAEPGENRVTDKSFKQSYIKAHSLEFDFKDWQLRSEH